MMKTPRLYFRTAAVLLILFAVLHTIGFRKVDPKWGIDSTITSLQTVQFVANGATHTYWDFYVGFGLFASLFLLFLGLLAWQLGGLPATTLQQLRITSWLFAACFAVETVLCWQYFFWAPVVFSVVITLCLIAAAALSADTLAS